MSFVFKVIARNPPTALFIIGAFLMIVGSFSNFQHLVDWGIICIVSGILLQVLWLLLVKRGL